MKIKNKTFDLFTKKYSFMLDEAYWNGWLSGKEEGLICLFINFKNLFVSLVITGDDCASISPELSWENHFDETTFPCDFDGFRNACEWIDRERIELVENLL